MGRQNTVPGSGGANHTFSFRLRSYQYDDNRQLTGNLTVTGSGQLTSVDNFTYNASIEVYDADGNLLVTLCGQSTATRFQ
jgi:hypothetical protein